MKKTSIHNGRKLALKDNGLPEGYALFWTTRGDKEYLYTKFHGQGLSCKTSDWHEAVDFVEKLWADSKKRENGTAAADVLVGELLDDLITYYEGLARKRGDYKPKTAYIAASQINMKDGIRDTFGGLKVSSSVRHVPRIPRQMGKPLLKEGGSRWMKFSTPLITI